RVDIVNGIRRDISADLLIPHIDLSCIPDDYWAFIQSHPRVVNRRIRDIRKTVYTTLRVRPGDGWDGPVIVKTINNCGGFADQWFAPRRPGLPPRAPRRHPPRAHPRER